MPRAVIRTRTASRTKRWDGEGSASPSPRIITSKKLSEQQVGLRSVLNEVVKSERNCFETGYTVQSDQRNAHKIRRQELIKRVRVH